MPTKKVTPSSPPLPPALGRVLGPSIIAEDNGDVSKIAGVVEAIFNTKDLYQKGNLKPHQVVHLVRGRVYAHRYKSSVMRLLVDSVFQMSLSEKGFARKDLRAALQAILFRRPDQQGPQETQLQKKMM